MPQLMGDEPAEEEETHGSARPRDPSAGEQVRNEGESTCGLCGRTLLAGETTELYLESGAASVGSDDPGTEGTFIVCAMCRPSARQHGYHRIA